jgi:hypothetical protein
MTHGNYSPQISFLISIILLKKTRTFEGGECCQHVIKNYCLDRFMTGWLLQASMFEFFVLLNFRLYILGVA